MTTVAELTLSPPSRIVAVIGTGGVGELIGTRRILSRGWLAYTKAKCRQAFICEPDVHVFGNAVANETSTQFRARFEAAGGILSVIRNWSPRPGVVVLDPFRDDVVGGLSLADMIANLDAFLAALLPLGCVVVIRTPTPRGGSNQVAARLTSTQLLQTMRFIENVHARRGTRGVIIADTWLTNSLRDSTTGDVGFNYTRDGVNGNARWGHADSLQMTEIFRFLYPTTFGPMIASNADIWDAANNPTGSFIRNPYIVGSNAVPGTDNSGTLPDNWFGNQMSNGVIAAYSRVANATSFDGQLYKDEKLKSWLQIVLSSPTPANVTTALVCCLFQNIDPTLLAIGDILSARAEFEIENPVNISRITFGIYDTNGGSANAATQLVADWDGQAETDSVALPLDTLKEAGIFRTPQTLGIAGVNNKQIQMRIKPTTAGAAVSGTIRLRSISGRKIAA